MHVLSDPEMHKRENNKSQDAKKKLTLTKIQAGVAKTTNFPSHCNEMNAKQNPKKAIGVTFTEVDNIPQHYELSISCLTLDDASKRN